jgi:hypothetical protein
MAPKKPKLNKSTNAIIQGRSDDIAGLSGRYISPERADCVINPPQVAFADLPNQTEEDLLAMGCTPWSNPDEEGNVVWLFPKEWYDHIPDRLPVYNLEGQKTRFLRGVTPRELRFSWLTFGFKRKTR